MNKKLASLVVALSIVLGMAVTVGSASANDGDGKKGRISLCHNGHTITVNFRAVPAHLAHWDSFGPCGKGKGGN